MLGPAPGAGNSVPEARGRCRRAVTSRRQPLQVPVRAELSVEVGAGIRQRLRLREVRAGLAGAGEGGGRLAPRLTGLLSRRPWALS